MTAKTWKKPYSHLVKRTEEKGNIEEEWLELKNNLRKTFEEVLGVETKVSTKEWFDADCEIAIGKKNEAYKCWLGRLTRARRTHYEQLRREANKIRRRKKRQSAEENTRKI
jgi:hypothetical protein